MPQAPLLLTSVTNCGKQEAVVAWDPVAGNPVASFSGEAASMGTLTAVNNVIFSAVAKKPILQSWSFQSNSTFKRLTIKGAVNALAFSDDGFFMYLAIEKSVYTYQVCSGCLIAVLEAGHMAPIGALFVSQRQSGLSLPLLLSADTSGLVACWPALISTGDSVAIGNRGSTNAPASESDAVHKPLWYVIQASRGLPSLAFVSGDRMVACAGTGGVKLFDSETGRLLHEAFEQSLPLLCICALPQDDRFIFAGTGNGILHSIWLRCPQNTASYEVSFRRCFVDSSLSSVEKAICCICSSPEDSDLPLIAVSTREGLVEVLRQDACLVRLRSFSVAQSLPGTAGSPRITGFLMLSRPSWLLEVHVAVAMGATSDTLAETDSSDALKAVRPIKRHMGWQVDDLLYLRLSNFKRDRVQDNYLEDIYKDGFIPTKEDNAFALPINVSTVNGSSSCDEVDVLMRKNESLKKQNGELKRILVANCLHY